VLFKQEVGHDTNNPSDLLPGNVKEFLGSAIDLPDKYVDRCWMVFRRTIWQWDVNGDSIGADAKLFREHGLQGLMCELSTYSSCVGSMFNPRIATRTLFPPTKVCIDRDCAKRGSQLRRKDTPRKVILFTLNEGVCATYSIHLICHGTLHPNF
jgi:hypothetical protein